MAEEKKKKNGITFEERVRRSMGTEFGKKKAEQIIKKDKEKGNDPTRIVARPPKRGPDLPKQGVTTVPKIAKEAKNTTQKEPKQNIPKVQSGKTASADTKPPKKETDPLAGKPRSIAEAKRKGQMYFFDKRGVKKLAVTKADLDRTGLSLKEYANKFAPKKVTKKEAEKFKIKKAGGGVMKKKGYAGGGKMKKKSYAGGGKMAMKKKMAARGGGVMKKKGMAAGGRTTMKKQMMRGGGVAGMKKKMMAGGGVMKKKGYAVGGAMKKKGMKSGGKVMKMRGGGLATRGTNFRIR
tara:strand:+ start:811 stop:1689 length:879 start_codon:yes stop_codon:yes gene_type:complete